MTIFRILGTALELDEACRVAVNQEIAPGDHVLSDGDEVALIPPVAGG